MLWVVLILWLALAGGFLGTLLGFAMWGVLLSMLGFALLGALVRRVVASRSGPIRAVGHR